MTITSITPAGADEGSAVDVVVLGRGFDVDTTIRIGPAALDGRAVDSDTVIRGRTPATLGVGIHDVIAQRGADVFVFPSGFVVAAADPVDGAGEGEGEGDTGDTGDGAPAGCGCAGVDGGVSLLALAVLVSRRRRRRGT